MLLPKVSTVVATSFTPSPINMMSSYIVREPNYIHYREPNHVTLMTYLTLQIHLGDIAYMAGLLFMP